MKRIFSMAIMMSSFVYAENLPVDKDAGVVQCHTAIAYDSDGNAFSSAACCNSIGGTGGAILARICAENTLVQTIAECN